MFCSCFRCYVFLSFAHDEKRNGKRKNCRGTKEFEKTTLSFLFVAFICQGCLAFASVLLSLVSGFLSKFGSPSCICTTCTPLTVSYIEALGGGREEVMPSAAFTFFDLVLASSQNEMFKLKWVLRCIREIYIRETSAPVPCDLVECLSGWLSPWACI